ncbi:MAG TPA: DUF6526 family protein [Phnomibacter sp.]|nr:DUF6526 family protein [Phnomibacter sp.]
MQPQQYSNHVRMVPGFHYVLSLIVFSCLVISSINLGEKLMNPQERTVEAIFFFFVSLALAGLYWFCRVFALKAQDRAIRAEENFRHFILTGKPMPSQLRMGQIVALRFASDAEFPALAQKAVAEQLPGKVIKQSIINWRPDFHRV